MKSVRTRATYVALAVTLSLTALASANLVRQTVPMRDRDLKGGGCWAGEVNSSVIDTSTVLLGTVRNPWSVDVTELEFVLTHAKTSSGTTTLNIADTSIPFDGAGRALVNFGHKSVLEGKSSETYRITGVEGDEDSYVGLRILPIVSQQVDGHKVRCNLLPEFELDALSDRARMGIQMTCPSALAVITNVDDSKRLSELSGTVSLPGDLVLGALRVRDLNGEDLPGANIKLDGSKFRVSLSPSLDADQSVVLLLDLSSQRHAPPIQAEIQAEFIE